MSEQEKKVDEAIVTLLFKPVLTDLDIKDSLTTIKQYLDGNTPTNSEEELTVTE